MQFVVGVCLLADCAVSRIRYAPGVIRTGCRSIDLVHVFYSAETLSDSALQGSCRMVIAKSAGPRSTKIDCGFEKRDVGYGVIANACVAGVIDQNVGAVAFTVTSYE